MPQTTHPLSAEDLQVRGTYALRRALDRLAHAPEAGAEPLGGEHVGSDSGGQRGAGFQAQEVGHVFQKVLLAVDGSEHSAKAVPVAADLAKKSDGEVVVFHVDEYTHTRVGTFPVEEGPQPKELVEKVTAELTAEGVTAHGVVEPFIHGEAASAILQEAQAVGADAIVMGSRGRSDLTGLLLGSVTHKVIQLSHCPVVVAR